VIRFLQSWGMPIVMTIAYAALAVISETSTTGKAWMAIGLAFVLVVWFLFRYLTEQAALSRAVAVGDAPRILELVNAQLRRRKRPASRVPYLVYRAQAHELRGDFPAALASLDEARLDTIPSSMWPTWQVLASAVRVGVLVETGKVADARRVLETELAPAGAKLDPRLHPSARLYIPSSIGRVLAAEGKHAEARPLLRAVLDDIRAPSVLRAVALRELARIADDPSEAAKHRAELAKLVPDANAYLRRV
jgi:tetratricopeptide (TPR) repeat protein